MKPSSKVFNDPIHGHIELSGLSVAIMDTPQFQRLRDVSQLGGVYYVFPGASSHRFEHSLGVSHLARQFVTSLRENQPELNITDSDALCVEVAGLCHDIGHGPYSHLYDGKFLPELRGNHDFAHEHASVGIFELLIAENNLMPVFNAFGLNEDDVQFIKELMLGDEKEGPPGFKWKGRGNDKTFLYDIVANKRNGIDVDKFDYFARDCHVLGITKSFDESRLMRFAKALRVSRYSNTKQTSTINVNRSSATSASLAGIQQSVAQEENNSTKPRNYSSHGTGTGTGTENETISSTKNAVSAGSSTSSSDHSREDARVVNPPQLEICYHVKEAWNIFELFHTRYALHKRAYQHKVCNAVELMLLEVLVAADPYLKFPGVNGALRKMSECPDDMHAYWKLSDCIIKTIETSYTPELAKAREMVQRLRTRDLFSFAGEIILSPEKREQLRGKGGGGGGGATAMTQRIKEEIVLLLDQYRVRVEEQNQNMNKNNNNTSTRNSNTSSSSSSSSSSEVHNSSKQDLHYPLSLPAVDPAKDVFCTIVKISYGKGSQNPVSGPTAFYEPRRSHHQQQPLLHTHNNNIINNNNNNNNNNDSSSPAKSSLADTVDTSVVKSAEQLALDRQEQQWNVGVVPQDSVSRVTPREFEEMYVRIFCRNKNQCSLIKSIFHQWCQQHDVLEALTPVKRSRPDVC